VVWRFEKDGQKLRCEVSRGDDAGPYRIVVRRPDGSEVAEDVEQAAALPDRLVAIMSAIRDEGWQLS
jgi:hypothetical protein